MQHNTSCFSFFSLPSVTAKIEILNILLQLCVEDLKHTTANFSFSFWTGMLSPRIQLQKKFAYKWEIELDEIKYQ